MKNRQQLYRFYLFIFFLSGFSGLIYESIWSHYLKLFLGHSAYAQTLVLIIFMGGMTVGAWLCARFSAAWKNLFLLYALAEAIVGLIALIFHSCFVVITDFSFQYVIPQLENGILISVYKWSLSALLLLPQSILLGATFPLMSAGLLRLRKQQNGASLSTLYFANSFGAAIGVLASGFILIRYFGLPGTLATAGLINITIAIVVYLTARSLNMQAKANNIDKTKWQQVSKLQNPTNINWRIILLSISLLTGLASFVYEIAWIRMLTLVLGSSTHAFELILATFIFGLAIGGLWIRRKIDKIKQPIYFLAIVQLIMAVCALLTVIFYNHTFDIMQFTIQGLAKSNSGYLIFNLSSLILCMIMLPATFCAGMTLPLITLALLKSNHGEKSIGSVYAFNTLGAIIGIILATHILLPLAGVKLLVLFGVCIDALLGLYLLTRLSNKPWYIIRKPQVVITLVCLIYASIISQPDTHKMASGVYRMGSLLNKENTNILFHRDGKTSSVDLVLVDKKYLSLSNNGKADAQINIDKNGTGTADEATMIMLSLAPMMHNPEAKKIAVIGMGSGLSTAVFLKFPSVNLVDTIEIEQAVVDAAKLFGPRVQQVYNDKRSRIHIDDAKSYFASNNNRYDIILSEPSNPWVSGIAGLFSTEFYQQASRYLSETGLFVQWIQLYEIDLQLVSSIFKAIQAVFPDYVVYMPDNSNIVLIASHNKIKPAAIKKIINTPSLKYELARANIKTEADMIIRYVANAKLLAPLFKFIPAQANSDYYPLLDQNAAKARFLAKNAHALIALSYSQLPIFEMLNKQAAIAPISTNAIPSVSPHLYNSELRNNALAIYQYLSSPANTIASGFSADIEFIKLFLSDCTRLKISAPLLDSLQNLSIATAAYLPAKYSSHIWQKIQSTKCFATLPVAFKNLITLAQAIAEKNSKQMIKISQDMLNNNALQTYFQSSRWKKYLTKVNMLGHLTENNYVQAINSFKRLRLDNKVIKQLWKYDLELTFLLAHSYQAMKQR